MNPRMNDEGILERHDEKHRNEEAVHLSEEIASQKDSRMLK